MIFKWVLLALRACCTGFGFAGVARFASLLRALRAEVPGRCFEPVLAG